MEAPSSFDVSAVTDFISGTVAPGVAVLAGIVLTVIVGIKAYKWATKAV